MRVADAGFRVWIESLALVHRKPLLVPRLLWPLLLGLVGGVIVQGFDFERLAFGFGHCTDNGLVIVIFFD